MPSQTVEEATTGLRSESPADLINGHMRSTGNHVQSAEPPVSSSAGKLRRITKTRVPNQAPLLNNAGSYDQSEPSNLPSGQLQSRKRGRPRKHVVSSSKRTKHGASADLQGAVVMSSGANELQSIEPPALTGNNESPVQYLPQPESENGPTTAPEIESEEIPPQPNGSGVERMADHPPQTVPCDNEVSQAATVDITEPQASGRVELEEPPTMMHTGASDRQASGQVPTEDMNQAEHLFGNEAESSDAENVDEVSVNEEDLGEGPDRRDDPYMPETIVEAVWYARKLYAQASTANIAKIYRGCNLSKHYRSIKDIDSQPSASEDHDNAGKVIADACSAAIQETATLAQPIAQEKRAALKHIFGIALPTLVRMLYHMTSYHIRAAGNLKRLSSEQVKITNRMIIKIIQLADITKAARSKLTLAFHYRKTTIRMIARIKEAGEIFRRIVFRLEQREVEARLRERRQLQQEEVNLETDHRKKLREWRSRWQALHTQRRGAELEGRISLPPNQDRHLALIPLEEVQKPGFRLRPSAGPIAYPDWDFETQVYPLTKGLIKFTGRYGCYTGDFHIRWLAPFLTGRFQRREIF